MNLTDHKTDDYSPNPKVVEFIENRNWTLRIGETDILANSKLVSRGEGRCTYESLTKIGLYWCRLRFTVLQNSPIVEFWVWVVAGDVSIPDSLIDPLGTVRSLLPPLVEVAVANGEEVLHGQGRAIVRIGVNFMSGDFGHSSWGNNPNIYCPFHPNQTGGKHHYMGITFPGVLPELVYTMGAYGGYFQNEDGSWVTEAQRPDLQANSHIHEHGKDKGWIAYSDPDNPWKDRMATFQANPDGQHACQWSVLGQALQQHPHDQGLVMLAEAAVHVYTRYLGAPPRLIAAQPQERQQGRVLKSAVDLFLALKDQPGSEALALLVGRRAMRLFEADKSAFIHRHLQTGIGFQKFANTGGYSPAEVGIHFWGMWKLHKAIEVLGADHLPDVHYWMREASRWCFNQFRFYDIQGDSRWSYPYICAADGTDLSGPASSAHFAWLAAMQHEPRNPAEQEKRRHIEALGAELEERFKS